MPIGPWKDWDACVSGIMAQYKKGGKSISRARAQKICGKMEAQLELAPCPVKYEARLVELGMKQPKAKEFALEMFWDFVEKVEELSLEGCRGPGDADRPASDFAIPRLRALPYKRGKRVQLNCARNALARLNQVKGATGEEKASARRKLESALRKGGGEPGEKLKRKYP